jgi:hypothetical protein
MNVIRPLSAECNQILFSNVPQPYSLWNIATNYAKGDTVVLDDCGSVIYESLTSSNNGNDPATATLDWLPIGVSNYFAMFDDKNGTQTVNNGSIQIVVEFSELVNSVALINLSGVSLQLEAWSSEKDWTIDAPDMDLTIQLRDIGVSSWYEWFTYQIKGISNYVNIDLPTFTAGVGRMTLDAGTGDAKLGSIVYGNQYYVGDTLIGLQAGIKDYSTKETDIFGDYLIVERDFKDTIRSRVAVPFAKTQQVKQLFAQYRAKPLVFVGAEEYEISQTYGFVQQFSVDLDNHATAYLDIEIQGL